MKRRVIKIGLGLFALALVGFLVAASGIIPLKASSGHWAVTRWILQFSQQRSTATHSLGIDVPELDDEALVLKGAGHYDFGCRSCHGAPGEPRPRIAQAMLPAPPDLAKHVPNSTPSQLFHVVKHGLKFTGMPAWPAPHRDDEVWAVVAFLEQLPQLDGAAYRELVHGATTPTPPMEALTPTTLSTQAAEALQRSCARCHGYDGLGRGSPAFPKLAGQRREYLENAIVAYAHGARHSGIMEPLAAGLADDTLRELATYYAGLDPTRPAATAPADTATWEHGRAIAQEGIRERRVPACIECHDPAGRRSKPAYPSLAGQPAEYLELQLKLFKDGHRGGPEYAHLMDDVAPRLKPEEMKAVALYFAPLSPDAQ